MRFWTKREFVNQVGDQAAALTVRNVNPYFVAPVGQHGDVGDRQLFVRRPVAFE